MTLCSLRFDGFAFEVNPEKLEVEHNRVVSSYVSGLGVEIVERVSEGIGTVKGEGEFAGVNCIHQFEELERLYKDRKKGLLTLPGMKPFYACFSSLSMFADSTPEVLRYKFEFLREEGKSPVKKVHIAKEGESLFEISHLYSIDLLRLAELNPHLRRADEINRGEKVNLC